MRSGWSCVCAEKIDSMNDVGLDYSILIIDVDADKNEINSLNNWYVPNKQKMEIFSVNAEKYQKNDWSKIEIYKNMLEIRYRLLSKADR